jgi:DNA-binding response OmpR family regulator
MSSLLIIEDDPLILRMYQQAFEFKKHKIFIADNGEDGLKLAKDELPDVILMDIMMPKMNGLEVLKMLKLNQDTKKIPVIMLTNMGEEKDVQTALSLGAIKYITKIDHTPKEVIHEVEQIISASTRDQIPE